MDGINGEIEKWISFDYFYGNCMNPDAQLHIVVVVDVVSAARIADTWASSYYSNIILL